MKSILNKIESIIDIPLKAFFTDVVEECLIYKYSAATNNGVVEQNKLEIRIITRTISKAEATQKALNRALINIDDESIIEDVQDIKLNGGGVLYDAGTQMYHYINNYIVIKKAGK